MKTWIATTAICFVAHSLTVSYSEAQQISTQTIIESLVPRPNKAKNRSMRGVKVEGRTTENAELNLYINFEYDSDKLKQDALITLDRLAEAMSNRRLLEFEFLIAGHTDGAGTDTYNQALSERRAVAVKRYLVDKRNIASARLIDKGFGERRLLDPADPENGVNRRVQIVTLSLQHE